jgi:DNA-binding NarL/FixJ family response regulator
MTKAAVVNGRGLEPCLCRFALGDVLLEVICSSASSDADSAVKPVASFDHDGVHFVVREVQCTGPQRADPLTEILTVREREIVRLVAAGLRNKQIAYELRLSEYTVAAYIKHICYKLQVRNRTAMVTRCNQLGNAVMEELAARACRNLGQGAPPVRV